MGMDFAFSVIPIMVIVGFIVVISMFIGIGVKGVSTWKKNNNSPILDVSATIVTKRTDFRRHNNHSSNSVSHSTVRSSYYVTFEFESRDRLELLVDSYNYGMMVEGDKGILKFQGTRFLGFSRSYN